MPRAVVTQMVAFFCALSSAPCIAQQVYKCTNADGSIVYSQTPCESDIGDEETVDATPHQGHRSGPPPGTLAYDPPEKSGSQQSRNDRTSGPLRSKEVDLSRMERTSLENQRWSALANLRKRHLPPGERAQFKRQLRAADQRLGIDAADLSASDQTVYEENGMSLPSTLSTIPSGEQPQTDDVPRTIFGAGGEIFYRQGDSDFYTHAQTGDVWIKNSDFLVNTATGESILILD